MKKRIIPVKISEKSPFRPNLEVTSSAPRPKKTSSRVVKIIVMGLNLPSHETIMAVKPLPPTRFESIEWEEPPTSKRPASPHIAPDTSIVRIITFLTFMPM